jgi:hypothetical protein
MLQLFMPDHFQELAAFLRKAYMLRFPRDGPLRLTALVATHEVNAPAGSNGFDADDGSTSSHNDSDDDD